MYDSACLLCFLAYNKCVYLSCPTSKCLEMLEPSIGLFDCILSSMNTYVVYVSRFPSSN